MAGVKKEDDAVGASSELVAEIGAAVDVVVKESEKERAAVADAATGDKKDLRPVKVEDAPLTDKDEGKGKKVDDEAPPVAITDALVERAVKSGMSIADAKAFQTADALERICSVLEKRGEVKKVDEVEAQVVEDPFAAIPDLDPNEYDEKVVAGFKAMKDIIKKQHEALTDMRRDGSSREAVSFFDSQVAALGKAYAPVVGEGDRSKLDPKSPQAKTRAELESKFNVLTAGYKAAGQDIAKETVFNEAVSLVMGDVQAKATAAEKSAALDKRARLHLARPAGTEHKPQADAFADTAAALDRKFFGKN